MAKTPAGPSAYADVIPMLDTALVRGTARFQCKSPSNATYIIHRMHKWRQIDRGASDTAESKYDTLIIRRQDEWIEIAPRLTTPFIAAFDGDGNPISHADVLASRQPTRRDIERMIDRALETPITPEIARQLALARQAAAQIRATEIDKPPTIDLRRDLEIDDAQ